MNLSLIQMWKSVKKDERLRCVLRQKAKTLRDHALDIEAKKDQAQSTLLPTKEKEKELPDLESLDKLHKILELCESTRVRLIHDVWLVGIVLCLILLVVVGLLRIKVGTTEIELELAATELEFTLTKPMLLLDTLHLSELGIFELQEVQLPRSQEEGKQLLQAADNSQGLAIQFSANEEHVPENEEKAAKEKKKEPENVITLTALLLPQYSTVRLRTTELPNTYRLIVTASDKEAMDIQLSVNGKIQVKQSGAEGFTENLEFPSKIRANTVNVESASHELTLDFKLSDHSSRELVPLIPAKNFDFTRIEEFGKNTNNPYSRRVSSILSGTLSVKELENKQYPLQYGDYLKISGFDGIIRQVGLEEDKMTLTLHGNVGGMETGPGQEKTSLMPSWFEYWQARRVLSLFWGTSVSLFGFAFLILRWLLKTS